MLKIRQQAQADSTWPFDMRDRGLLLADGVFDTSLMLNGEIMFQTAHMERLVRDAKALNITVSASEIEDMMRPLADTQQSGALRVTVTRGPNARGLTAEKSVQPTLIAALTNFDRAQSFQPISLKTSEIRRNSSSPTSRHKTLNYVDNVLAMQRAQADGYDNALFTNEAANVCCTTIGNVFLLIDGAWRTPPVSDGVLGGVMRNWLLNQADALSLEIVEETVPEARLVSAESVMMTNSLRLFCPVTRIDDLEFDIGPVHRLVKATQAHLPGSIASLMSNGDWYGEN